MLPYIMINKKRLVPIKKIIQQTLQRPAYRRHWLKHRILVVWRGLFPHLPKEPVKLFVKGSVVYFGFSSLILANTLRQQKAQFLAKLQAEMAMLDLSGKVIEDVVFL